MPFFIRTEIDGLEAALRRLDALPAKVSKRVLRKAVSKATQKLAKAVKAAAPKRTGILKKSIGSKVKRYPSGVVVGVVGARKGFRQQVGVRKRDSRLGTKYPGSKGDPIYVNPVKYLHLVELGTTHSRAFRFLSRTTETLKPSLRDEMTRIIDEGIRAAVENQ